jgi:hypothetical protein
MKRIILILSLLVSNSGLAQESSGSNSVGWIFGVSHLSTEILIKSIKDNDTFETSPTGVERALASVIVAAVMMQVVRSVSIDEDEFLVNSGGVAIGITTGNLFQLEW